MAWKSHRFPRLPMSPRVPLRRLLPVLFAVLSAGSRAQIPPAPPVAPVQLEKYDVTGSRIKRSEEEGPSPVVTITRAELELAAANNLVDVVSVLPEAGAMGINESNSTTIVRGASAVNLRGLGPNNTLVLVNGRRQAPNGIDSGGTVFVDLNRTPNAMVERVEILKDGASAIYGADATAGVINIITRRNYTGGEVSTRYGNYFKTDAAEQAHAFVGGTSHGRLHAMVSLSFTSRNAIAATDLPVSSDPDFTARLKARDPVKYAFLTPTATTSSTWDLRSGAGPFATVSVPTAAQLTGIRNNLTTAAIRNPLTGATAVNLPGTGGVPAGTIGSTANAASVPRTGNSGRPAAAEFVTRNYAPGDGGNSFNFQPFVWIVPETLRRGISAELTYDLPGIGSAYANVSVMRIASEIRLAPTPIATSGPDYSILVPASNYYNPFGIPVAFTYRPLEVGSRTGNIDSRSINVGAGLRGTWAGRFDWQAGGSYSRNRSTDSSHNSISESRLRAALAKSTPDAFNIFGGPGFRNDPATVDSIKTVIVRSGLASTRMFDASVSTARLALLPTGHVGAAVFAEHRGERFAAENDEASATLDDEVGASRAPPSSRSARRVDSVAAELRVPFVPEDRFRWLNRAELNAAVRYESYSNGFDSGMKPSAGLRLRPVRGVLLRGSYGKVFRPPTLPQMYAGVLENTVTGLTDLRRPSALTGDSADGTTAPRLLRSGGNPNLRPEIGTTQQAGLVVDVPGRWFRGLSLEATHGQIANANVIRAGLGTAFIRQNELTSTGDLVVREPGTFTFTNTTTAPIAVLSGPGGLTTPVAPGASVTVPGRMVLINDTALNLSNQEVRYYDYGLRFERGTERWGRFRFQTNWSYLRTHQIQRQRGDAYVSAVGRAQPRYRGQASATWARGAWNANLGMNYIHRTWDIVRDLVETERYTTYSVGAGYAFRRGSKLGALRISVGIDNLFDRDPPLDPFPNGYNGALIGRPAGRYGFIALRREL